MIGIFISSILSKYLNNSFDFTPNGGRGGQQEAAAVGAAQAEPSLGPGGSQGRGRFH